MTSSDWHNIAEIVIVLGAVGFGIGQWRLGRNNGGQESNQILRSLNDDLKNDIKAQQDKHTQEVADIQEAHTKEIAGFQAQITALTGRVTTLETLNSSLVDKAFNKDLLTKMELNLEKLSQMMVLFLPLVAKDGYISKAETNHAEMMRELDDIHQAVVIDKK